MTIDLILVLFLSLSLFPLLFRFDIETSPMVDTRSYLRNGTVRDALFPGRLHARTELPTPALTRKPR